VWGFIFGGCFLVGVIEVFEGMVEDMSIKTVGMDAGLENMGEKWACDKIWAPFLCRMGLRDEAWAQFGIGLG
jgi:hypothetical protein